MKHTVWLLFFFGNAFAASVPDLDQLLNKPLEHIPENIKISGRFSQSSATSPGPVHIVTAQQIDDMQLHSISDILRLFAGIHIMQDGNFTYLVSRGIGQPGDFNSRLLFLVDGARINENTRGIGFIGEEFFLDTNLIDRVEYYPGAPSAGYGANAMLGVIHIITKQSSDLKGLRLLASASNFKQNKLQLVASTGSSADFEGWFSASFVDNRKFVPFLNNLNIPQVTTNANNDEKIYRFSSKVQWRNTRLLLANVQRKRNHPVGSTLSKPLTIEEDTENFMATIQHDQHFNHALSAFFTLSTFQQKFERDIPYLNADNDIMNEELELSGRWSTLDARFNWQPNAVLNWWSGIDIIRDHSQVERISLLEFNVTQNLEGQNTQFGVFTDAQWQLNPSLALHLGARYDNDKYQLSHVSPQAAVLWQPSPSLQFKLRYGRSNRSPSFIERVYNQGLDIQLPTVEFINSTDFYVNYKINSHFHVFSNVYEAKLNNLIVQPLPNNYYINAPVLNSKGIETGFDFRWRDVEWQASASFQRSEIGDFGRISNSPSTLFKSQFKWRFAPDWHMQWQVYGVSERRYAEDKLPGYMLYQVGFGWSASEQLNLVAAVKNVTDQFAPEIPAPFYAAYQQQPRTVSLTLQWRFW